MAEFSHTIRRGDTRTFTATATYPPGHPQAGQPYPLTGKILYFTAKRSMDEPDSAAFFMKQVDDGIQVLAPPNDHKARITVNGSDTARLTGERVFVCDLQVIDAGEPLTLAFGQLRIRPDITRTIS
jgi:hypothetical protein